VGIPPADRTSGHVSDDPLVQECLANACLDGEADQIKEVLRAHFKFSSESGQQVIREEMVSEVRKVADRLHDIDGVLQEYRSKFGSLPVPPEKVKVDWKATAADSAENPKDPLPKPPRIAQPPAFPLSPRVPQVHRFVPTRSYEGRSAAFAGGPDFRWADEEKDYQDFDLQAGWEVSYEMRRNLAEKLKQGAQRRAQKEKLWHERMLRRQRGEEDAESASEHEEEFGKANAASASPKLTKSGLGKDGDDADDSWFSPNSTYQWNQGNSSAYAFRASAHRDDIHAASGAGNASGKPNTEYAYRYAKGEQQTWSTPGPRPASREGVRPQAPPRPPESPGPRMPRPSPRARYPGTSAPDTSTAPPSPSSASSQGPGQSARPKASANPSSPKNAEANAPSAGGFFNSNQRRWGTANWGKSGWGSAAGWNIPKPPPQPKQPSYAHSQWHSQAPPPKPPAVATAVAAAKTPAEASILTGLEARLQELRRLPKEEQKKCSKELMVRWHPDKNPGKGDESTRIFQWLQNRKKELLGL